MSSFKEQAGASYEPVLPFLRKEEWKRPDMPIGIMDRETHDLIEIDDLYYALNYAQTEIGRLVLRRSLNSPIEDSTLIRAKQESLAELRADPEIRSRFTQFVSQAAENEKLLLAYYRGDYGFRPFDHPNLYDAYNGSTRLLLHLARDLQDIHPQSDYLNFLLENFSQLGEKEIIQFIEGPVFRTPQGLKSRDEVGFFTPEMRFIPTDKKPVRLLLVGGPVAIIAAGVLSGNFDTEFTSLLCAWGYAGTTAPLVLTVLGRKIDDKLYGKPLAQMYFTNPEVVSALESLGDLDELLSFAKYADALKVPTTLPTIDDASHHHFEAQGLRNPVLAKDNPSYIPNDVDLNGSRLTFLTGPNSGGKTALSKTILQSQVLAQIGSYIPAQEASVSVADGIFYHSPMVNSLRDTEGRFAVESTRTRDIFKKTTPKTIVILDELIEATTHEAKLRHSKDILEGFYAIGGNTILVTHNYELAEQFQEMGVGQFWQVEFDGAEPTHRVIPGISTDSHSDEVLQRLGFTRDDIEKHLRKMGYKTGE